MATLAEIRPLIEEKLSQLGLELHDIKYSRAGARSVLRVFIDKEHGVTIDDCEEASREISPLLDVENFSKTPYRLDVSSPGADRPLKTEKDFRRARGRVVRLHVNAAEGRARPVSGTVVGCEDNILRLQSEQQTLHVPLSDIASAKIEFSFK